MSSIFVVTASIWSKNSSAVFAGFENNGDSRSRRSKSGLSTFRIFLDIQIDAGVFLDQYLNRRELFGDQIVGTSQQR